MWKWLLYSLILFNIGFFAWNAQRGIPLKQHSQNQDLDGAVKLLLLKEQPLLSVNESEDKKINMCFSLGPFVRKTEARAVKKKLLKWDIDATQRTHKTVTDGFWVIIPATKTRKAANNNIKRLKELGVRDYFLVATGSQKNAISLGVFSKSSSARRRLAAMDKKGVKAKITGVDLPKRSYWLDWPGAGLALTPLQLGSLQKSFKGIGTVSVECHL